MVKITDLTPFKTSRVTFGQRFSKLTVTDVGRTPERRYYAVCDCECGTRGHLAQIGHLKNGRVKSCGCGAHDKVTTHGLSKNPVFSRWQGMMRRCYSPDFVGFHLYGGRGIKVCDRWHDPSAFVRDMQDGFAPHLELDRFPDKDGDYAPGNVRWVEKAENLYNRRNTKTVSFNGETLTLAQWEQRLSIPRKLLAKRIYERGWSVEKAFATPVLTRSETAKIANAARNALRV